MPNDAKLGLIVGVGVVLLIATIFFRKDASAHAGSNDTRVMISAGSMPRLPPLPSAETPTPTLPPPPSLAESTNEN